jgi:hypothetical protein
VFNPAAVCALLEAFAPATHLASVVSTGPDAAPAAQRGGSPRPGRSRSGLVLSGAADHLAHATVTATEDAQRDIGNFTRQSVRDR